MKKNILFFFAWVMNFALFAQAPAGYYTSAENLTGFAKKTALYNIIKGHTTVSYSNLYRAYQGTYTSGVAGTDIKPNGKVWDMYSDVPNGTPPYEFVFTETCGSYSVEGDCYNREHTVPQSWFNSASPMVSDLFHVYPTDGKVNGLRDNNPYGIVAVASKTTLNGSKSGTSASSAFTGTVFEPINEYKGDLARGYFYMATRYENVIAGWKLNGNADDVLNGTSTQVFDQWQLDVLYKWHLEDPVSTKEINRNNVVYQLQGNRNPYIDHPEWVAQIWGLASTVQFNVLSASQSEGNSGNTTVNVQVNISPANAYASSVFIALDASNSTAQAGDYSFTPQTLSFSANQTSKTFPINIIGDATIESNETVKLKLETLSPNLVLGTNSTYTLTILNDDNTTTWNGSVWNNGAPSSSINAVIAGNYTQSGNLTTQNLTINSGATLTLSSSHSISIKGNLANNGSIGGVGTLEFSGSAAQQITGNSFFINNLTVNNTSGLTLSTAVNLMGTLAVNAGTLTTSGNLTLVSNSNGTARIASLPTGSNISGNVTVQRFIPSGFRKFRFIGSPVSNFDLQDLKDDIFITGNGGAANGFDPTQTNNPSAFMYNESLSGDLNIGFEPFTSITTSIPNGKGIRVMVRGDRSQTSSLTGGNYTPNNVTLDLTGNILRGNQSLPVTFTNSGNLAADGWNLVANPYPSNISWTATGWTKTNIANAVYLFRPALGSYSSFVGGVGNNGGSDIIPSMSAFWVKATAASPVLSLTENVKIGSEPSVLPFKLSGNDILRISLTNSEGITDESVVRFHEAATEGFDNELDAFKISGDVINISTKAESYLLSINSLPTFARTIQININAQKEGNFKLKFEMDEMAKVVNIKLIDKYLSTETILNNGNEYSFAIEAANPATQGENRFEIVIEDKPTSLEDELLLKNISIHPNPSKGEVNFTIQAKPLDNVQLKIYNLLGHLVYSSVSQGSLIEKINFINMGTGIYIANININGFVKSKKFTID